MELDITNLGAGVDIVSVARFTHFIDDKNHPFLVKVFLKEEINYCFSYADPAVHLAGLFALKEAVSKCLGIREYPFSEIEVRHSVIGAPIVWHNGKKLSIRVSISHTNEFAVAIAVT